MKPNITLSFILLVLMITAKGQQHNRTLPPRLPAAATKPSPTPNQIPTEQRQDVIEPFNP